MSRIPMKDLIVVLPGVMGSVLSKDNRNLWDLRISEACNAVFSRGAALDPLIPAGDDPETEDLGDGVSACSLIRGATIIPGLVKLDGYGPLIERLKERFVVTHGTPDSQEPINLLEFPYDWRRDNRSSARRLKRVAEQKLAQWRAHSGADEAKLIIIAHSMGGLVSRYYLEVLGGYKHCKALITLGTPFNGSPEAIGFLANGIKKASIDLTRLARACQSVYQLLPVYPALQVGNQYKRVVEFEALPNIDIARAQAAREFHREIRDAVRRRVRGENADAYTVIPLVGVQQPTVQSAKLENGQITVANTLPSDIDPLLDLGDGTVPHCAAIPLELEGRPLTTFIAEKHATLPCNKDLLKQLEETLRYTQVRGLVSFETPYARPMLSVSHDDLYQEGESVDVRAEVKDGAEDTPLQVILTSATGRNTPILKSMKLDGAAHIARIEGVAADVWRIEVRPVTEGPLGPTAVHDVFQVTPAATA